METKASSSPPSLSSQSDYEQSNHAAFKSNVLPIFDHLSQIYISFQYLDFIQIFLCAFQIFDTSFWMENGGYWSDSKVEKVLHYIFYFSSNRIEKRDVYIYFGVYCFFVLIIFVLFISLIIHFQKTRRIIKSFLYIIRLYFLFFGALIIHPIASFISNLFYLSIEEQKIEFIVMLICMVAVYFISVCMFYMNQKFANQSIYIHKSWWSTFDSTGIFFFFIWNPVFLIFSHVFDYHYPIWTFYILLVTHVLIIFLTLTSFYKISLPFIVDFRNCFEYAMFTSLVFNDIFRFVVEFFPNVEHHVFIIVCYLAFLVFLLVYYYVFLLIRKKINYDLSYFKLLNANLDDNDDANNMRQIELSNDEKFDYFDSLNLNKKMNKAMTYLVVGFTSGSDMFIDFSLFQYCFDNYKDNTDMIILLIHLVSYFKSEKKRLDECLYQFHLFRGVSTFNQFIYFQAFKIKVFRQETPTNTSTTRLTELRILSNDLKNQIRSFWSSETANLNTLEKIEQQQRELNYLWDESIEDNWSSVLFREEHIQFLIESCTDFQKAVEMTSIKDKINILRNDKDDLCFLSLIACFPQYIKNKIIDRNGDVLIKRTGKDYSTSTTSSSNHSDKYSTYSNENDFSYEEQIANNIISYGRLRLSMQNALKYIVPTIGKILNVYTIFAIVILFVLIFLPFAFFINSFNSIDDWNQEVGVLNELRISYGKSFLSLTILYGQTTNRFFPDNIECSYTNDRNHYFFDNSVPFDKLSLMFVNSAREYYSNLMSAILNLALSRVDISTLTNLFFDESINSNICYYGKIIDQANWSMEKMLNFHILSFEILSNDDDIVNWYNNNTYWCHDITTFPDVEKRFTVIHNALTYDLSNSSYSKSKSANRNMITIIPIYFIVFFIPFPIIIYFYTKEINHLINLMLSTDQEYKEQARRNISITVTNDNNEISPPISKKTINMKLFLYIFTIFFSFFVYIICSELILYNNKIMNNKFRNIGFWTCYFSLLRSYLTELLTEIINAVYFGGIQNNYLSIKIFQERIRSIMRNMKGIVYEILNDTPDSPPSVGTYSLIDEVVLQPICDYDSSVELHGLYQCASLSKVMSTIYALSTKISDDIEKLNGIFQGEECSNIYHIVFAHAIHSVIRIVEFFSIVQDDEISNFRQTIIILFICGLISLIIWIIFMLLLINNYQRVFQMALCLIRRLSPIGLINNNELINYLLYKKGEEVEMGVTHTIFNNSFDGIICMNLDGIVEIINKSFANDYGYSTEQLVGQLVGTIFDNESRVKLENQLKLIKNHESSGYNDDVICLTNDGRSIPSHITLFAIKGKESNLIMVVRDETVLLQKKRRLESAKKQSQDLLEQIMPPKILKMLKEGQNEISFAVESATVMFVDIVNFSRFSADLSPQQIMGTLSSLFGSFDTWIQKYPLMTKIKLIGDIYMAACGLFVEENPKNHAEQCIDFAILVLDIVDDTNIKLNINLQIRIGVNTDGPIIAGVLGTENRVFDIIGDTINVASRLEHKADPGHILMSEKTYELVCDAGYIITPKGEVFLKGKGNMQAYEI